MSHITTFFHEANRARWNGFVSTMSNAHLMQGYEWGRFKTQSGWKLQRVGVEKDGDIVAGAQILFRKLPGVPYTLAYLSKGPLINLPLMTDEQYVISQKLWQTIHQASRQQQAIFLMTEPNFPDAFHIRQYLHQLGFQTSDHTNHPHSTIIVDLNHDEATLLKNMRKKTRQLIRKAGRNGVTIVEGDEQDLAEFYQVIQTTANLKNIPSHQYDFYHQVWQTYQPNDAVKLFFAKHDGQTVATKMVFRFGERSLHLWGGTTRQGRAMQASYLIQWEALKWAKQQGCQQADLWGIPDEVGRLLKKSENPPKDKRNDLWGIYLFKRGFGGQVESYVGTYNYVYKPMLYRLADQFRHFSVDSLSTWVERLRGIRS
ncbi:peptidoglycan bridge formation glycyltransferase FemA/FemB family protein [Anaerolineales bacterium HSG6]|nr:peptidoglycan bridge formation glycyltransferase FemA/FemB family protein [Anaerolineales bacterium HSG6]